MPDTGFQNTGFQTGHTQWISCRYLTGRSGIPELKSKDECLLTITLNDRKFVLLELVTRGSTK